MVAALVAQKMGINVPKMRVIDFSDETVGEKFGKTIFLFRL